MPIILSLSLWRLDSPRPPSQFRHANLVVVPVSPLSPLPLSSSAGHKKHSQGWLSHQWEGGDITVLLVGSTEVWWNLYKLEQLRLSFPPSGIFQHLKLGVWWCLVWCWGWRRLTGTGLLNTVTTQLSPHTHHALSLSPSSTSLTPPLPAPPTPPTWPSTPTTSHQSSTSNLNCDFQKKSKEYSPERSSVKISANWHVISLTGRFECRKSVEGQTVVGRL